jgi:hypothetical protein
VTEGSARETCTNEVALTAATRTRTHEHSHNNLARRSSGPGSATGTRRCLCTLRRLSRCGRTDGPLYIGYAFCGVHGRQRSDSVQDLHSREDLAPVFADLNKYAATTHFVGQSTISTLTKERATGETYCLAHHVKASGDKRHLMVASLRYLNTFTKIDGLWFFAERQLYVDWVDERPLS